MNKKISVLIPAYNEETRIRETIYALKKIPMIKQIVVVDDGSTDNTAKIAEELGAEVIKSLVNQGKGAALNLGAEYLSENYIALADADLGNTAVEIEKLVIPVTKGIADMSIAVFPPAQRKGGIGFVKKTANYGLKVITGINFTAPLSGQRVLTRKLFLELVPFSPGFGVEVGMTIDAFLKGYKILEVPTNMSHQETGRNLSGFIHRGNQFKDIFFTLTLKGWRKWGYS